MGTHFQRSRARVGLLYERSRSGYNSFPPTILPFSDISAFQADPYEPDWKQSFYGRNYQDLYAIKAKFDPDHIFYGPTAVGSDEWQMHENGALCWIGPN